MELARETARSRRAFDALLSLGPGASLMDLQRHFEHLAAEQQGYKPPTRQLGQLKRWSGAFDWQVRRDEHFRREAEATRVQQAEDRRRILSTDLALDHNRIELLIKLARTLEKELTAEGTTFDEAKYRQLRGLLDDVAKEVGDRVQRHEYLLLERKAEELAAARGLDVAPSRVINFAERLAQRGVAL
jgi:hypothetical protein